MNKEILKQLSREEFVQSPGKYWRELAEVRRFREASELIEHYLSLHPELEPVNASTLYFHAGHCRAMGGDTDEAIRLMSLALHQTESSSESTSAGLLWNEYVTGTVCFLQQNRHGLELAHATLALSDPVNLPNLRVLDRLIAGFGQPYDEACDTDGQDHRKLSADSFNRTWELLEKKDRTEEENERMISLAHASLAHWRMREDCTDQNLSIGYWQISRVYAVLEDGENAKRYGELCLAVSETEPPFYLGYAHEALARAALVQKNRAAFDQHLAEARTQAALVTDPEERKLLEDDLAGLSWR